MSRLCVILLLTFVVTAVSAGCRTKWCKLGDRCLNETVAQGCWKAPSVAPCMMKAGASPGDLVAQWNERTAACCLFRYQTVCRHIQARNATESPSDSRCSVYRFSSLSSCSESVGARFVAAWLAGGGSRFDNLVCQAEPSNYRLHSENVDWTEDGAKFDGASSYAATEDVGNVVNGGSFTWLLRLKRQPRVQPFMEAGQCDNLAVWGPHLWEFDNPGLLYYNVPEALVTSNVLPMNAESWIDIGVSRSERNCNLYFNGSFVVTKYSNRMSPRPCYVIQVGRRYPGDFLKATVKAVAIANASMTEREISQFFASLP